MYYRLGLVVELVSWFCYFYQWKIYQTLSKFVGKQCLSVFVIGISYKRWLNTHVLNVLKLKYNNRRYIQFSKEMSGVLLPIIIRCFRPLAYCWERQGARRTTWNLYEWSLGNNLSRLLRRYWCNSCMSTTWVLVCVYW